MKILFVCLGNICRSPTAEAVLRHMASSNGLKVTLDSAGTAAYHIGKAPDERTQQAALKRGITMSQLKARQVTANDFLEFDLIFAMDQANYESLSALATDSVLSNGQRRSNKAKLFLFLDKYGSKGYKDVPDPYYGEGDGFELVLDLLTDACHGFLKNLEVKK
ncbi:MAG: protein-tyrosine phosphatase [Bermanella sp.]|jgi:protein-tyrosine phosphatase